MRLGGCHVSKAVQRERSWRRALSHAPVDLIGSHGNLCATSVVRILHPYPSVRFAVKRKNPLGSKRNRDDRKKFGAFPRQWADAQGVMLENCLTEQIQNGFPQGDDAFDAVVGLFGMLQVCLGERGSGEPKEARRLFGGHGYLAQELRRSWRVLRSFSFFGLRIHRLLGSLSPFEACAEGSLCFASSFLPRISFDSPSS